MPPLCELRAGTVGVVDRLQGGLHFTTRVAAMGLTPGVEITVIQNHHHGPLLVGVRGTRIALGQGEAEKIFVRVGA